MTASTVSTHLHEAQLYWDDSDPQSAGWYLRYRDDRGEEQGTAVEAPEDASTQYLAEAVAAESHWLPDSGIIVVVRRSGARRGSITLSGGHVSDWREI